MLTLRKCAFSICSRATRAAAVTSFDDKFVLNGQIRNYAARKGTREKRKKAKVKVEEVKKVFVPHNVRKKEKLLALRKTKIVNDSWMKQPVDDVYVCRYYQWKVYPFLEALQCHRETHHPEMYNQPNANLHITIELNMEGEKKTRFVDNFSRIVSIPHKFDQAEERSIIAFTKDIDTHNEIREMGANLVGSVELIKEVQNGNVSLSDFQFFIAHPNILPELVVLRGLMRRRFPNPKSGTLDVDLTKLVHKFLNGIKYSAVQDEVEKNFGQINTIIGTLNMDGKHLEENYAAFVQDVMSVKPKRPGEFIRRCLMWSPPSSEKLKVEYESYVENVEKEKKIDKEDDEEAFAATA